MAVVLCSQVPLPVVQTEIRHRRRLLQITRQQEEFKYVQRSFTVRERQSRACKLGKKQQDIDIEVGIINHFVPTYSAPDVLSTYKKIVIFSSSVRKKKKLNIQVNVSKLSRETRHRKNVFPLITIICISSERPSSLSPVVIRNSLFEKLANKSIKFDRNSVI